MTPIGWSGVTISDSTLYAGSKEGRLVSVNLAASPQMISFAEPLRAAPTGGIGCASSGGGGACGGAPPAVAIYGTPVISENLVYLAGYNGKIFAYNANNLQQRWVFPVEGNLAPIVSGIAVAEDTLYFGGTDGKVYALDTESPERRWEFTTGGEIWATPVVSNGTVFVSSFDKKVYALDAATGDLKWEFATEATNVATPLVADGIVYVGSLDRNIYALNENDGSLVWSFSGGNWFWSQPVIHNGIVFAPCLDSWVYGLDARTGERRIEYNVEGQVSSSPVVVNDQLIVATRNGRLLSLSTSPASPGQLLIANIVDEVTAPLGVSNDVVYVNAPDNNIYAYNVATGARFSPISLGSQ